MINKLQCKATEWGSD